LIKNDPLEKRQKKKEKIDVRKFQDSRYKNAMPRRTSGRQGRGR